MKDLKPALPLGQSLLLLLFIFILCTLITGACAYLVGRLASGNPSAAMRISAVVQDVLMFIIPAVITALMVTRRPAELLALMKKPGALPIVAVILILVVSIPLQEAIIYLNYHLKLPEAWSSFENTARELENNAFEGMKLMLANTSVGALIVNILIIGLLAGLSEELLFRGCFQRLLVLGGVNRHLAVWIVAFCFSALHFQLFGFIPRMLLGAYFGYLLLWTGSLWVPVAAHVLNNVMFVITGWLQVRSHGIDALDNEPELWPVWVVAASLAATATVLFILRKSIANGVAGQE